MGSIVFALVLAATPAQVLLSPLSYSRGVFVSSNGTAVAGVLVVRTTAVDAESLGEEESRKWQQLASRVRDEYPAADERKRAALTRDVLTLAGPGVARTSVSVWLCFPDGSLTLFERVSYPDSGVVWLVADVPSGQYAGTVTHSNAQAMAAAIRELMADASSATAAAKVRDEAARIAEQTEGFVEVNGQRQWLARGSVSAGALAAEFVALLPNLVEDARARILEGLALLAGCRAGTVAVEQPLLRAATALCAAPLEAEALPLPPLPAGLALREMGGRAVPALEPVGDDVLDEFLGEHRWTPPDLAEAFPRNVRKLLSGAR